MKIYLYRHGDKQDIKTQDARVKQAITLTPLGIDQITNLAEKLATIKELAKLEVIYASPYPRAIQSAEIVRRRLNIPQIITDLRLGEYYAYNDYTKSREHRRSLHKTLLTTPDFVSPETKMSLNMYLAGTLAFLQEQFATGQPAILVSTHGALIRSLVYSLDKHLKPSDDNIVDATILEGGYTLLDFDGQTFKVLAFDVA